MSCSNHKKDIAGISDMKELANLIGDLHYETLEELFYHLYKKIESDGEKDYAAGREKLASAIQYISMSIFESYLRIGKAWQISKPFMEDKTTLKQ